MEKRYQVFVSSTFWDLEDARRAVMHALLQGDCIPAGMELFPASDEESWELIKSVIDDCDYYLVIIAGRYGTIDPSTGHSYTEMEYRYALEKGLPIVAFIHSCPDSLPSGQCEKDPIGIEKLEAFKKLIAGKAYRKWSTPQELGYEVIQALLRLRRVRPAVGWIRGDQATSDESNAEILRLRRIIETLEQQLDTHGKGPPSASESYAQGDDQIELEFGLTLHRAATPDSAATMTDWLTTISVPVNRIFREVGMRMLNMASEEDIRDTLSERFFSDVVDEFEADEGRETVLQVDYNVIASTDCIHTVIVQLFVLGLIKKVTRTRSLSLKERSICWELTEYGQDQLMRLRAVARVPIEG